MFWNRGRCSERYGGLSGYSTSMDADRDVKDLDIGYHFATGQYADTDGDGMPDVWEVKWFGGLGRDGTGHYDNDGLTDLEEYLHGTYPNNANSDDDDLDDAQEVMRGGGAMDWNFPRGPYLHFTWPDETLKVWVRWNSDDSYVGTVRYWAETPGFQFQYDSDDQAASSHEIDLTGDLPANACIFYDIGTGTGETYEAEYGIRHFWTPASGEADFQFIVYGDNRGPTRTDTNFRQEHARVIAGVLEKTPNPRFVLHVGDLVYVAPDWVGQWDPHFFQPAQPLLEIAPVFPCLGNHEYNNASANFQESMREYFIDYFTLPNNERWYSFEYGDCHFTCLDVNNKIWFDQAGDEQRQWLSADLAGAAGKQMFVWLHHPPFSSGPHGYNQESPGIDVRNYLVSIFQQHGVKAVLAGHDHLYERALCTEQGNPVRYIVTGGGGAPLSVGHDDYAYPPDSRATQEELYDKTPESDAFHFSIVAVTTSAFSFEMYKWNGEGPKDEWP